MFQNIECCVGFVFIFVCCCLFLSCFGLFCLFVFLFIYFCRTGFGGVGDLNPGDLVPTKKLMIEFCESLVRGCERLKRSVVRGLWVRFCVSLTRTIGRLWGAWGSVWELPLTSVSPHKPQTRLSQRNSFQIRRHDEYDLERIYLIWLGLLLGNMMSYFLLEHQDFSYSKTQIPFK